MSQIILMQPWHSPQNQVPAESLGIGYLVSFLRKHQIDVEILGTATYRTDRNQFFQEILQRKPKLIGISVHSQMMAEAALDTISELRQRNSDAHICLGGIWPSVDHIRILENWGGVDSIVRGDGEITFAELAQAILNDRPLNSIQGITYRQPNGDIHSTPDRTRILDINELPFPARDTLPEILKQVMFAQIQASRGCHYNKCIFCSTTAFYGSDTGIVTRNANSVVDEIEKLLNDFNCHYFHFSDDNFIDLSARSKMWVNEFCKEIKKRGLCISFRINNRSDCINHETMQLLKEAGLWEISVGVETNSQKTLTRYRKGTTLSSEERAKRILKTAKIRFKPNLILFDPYANWNEVNETIRYMENTRLYSLRGVYRILQPYTGTELRQQMIDQGLFIENAFWDLGPYRFQDPKVTIFHSWIEDISSTLSDLNDVLSNIKDNWIWPITEYERIYHQRLPIAANEQFMILENYCESVERNVIQYIKFLAKYIDDTDEYPDLPKFISEMNDHIVTGEKLLSTAQNVMFPPVDFI